MTVNTLRPVLSRPHLKKLQSSQILFKNLPFAKKAANRLNRGLPKQWKLNIEGVSTKRKGEFYCFEEKKGIGDLLCLCLRWPAAIFRWLH